MDNAIVRYLRSTWAELHKVSWPTRQEAWSLTKIVLGVMVSMAVFLGALDWLFSEELRAILNRSAWAFGVAAVVVVAVIVVIVVLKRRAEY